MSDQGRQILATAGCESHGKGEASGTELSANDATNERASEGSVWDAYCERGEVIEDNRQESWQSGEGQSQKICSGKYGERMSRANDIFGYAHGPNEEE